MKAFDQVWQYSDTIPGSFTRLSGEKLYERALAADGPIVEVGVDQGRSASVLLYAVSGTTTNVILVDSWESILIDNRFKVEERFTEWFPDAVWTTINMKSVDAAKELNLLPPIALIHIDANHYAPNPAQDCEAWLPKLKSGGVACFHDYHPSWPDVVAAVDKYTAGWEDLGVWDSLAIRRKP